ncbi:Trypsin-7 [Aphelenchoides fujianensis]|nr:Trypsin-7 [Aphelenchoides fujianensis]
MLSKVEKAESDRLSGICGRSTATQAISGFNKLGGVLISDRHLLTVAHGFLRFDNSKGGACSSERRLSITSSRPGDWAIIELANRSNSTNCRPDLPADRPTNTSTRCSRLRVGDGRARSRTPEPLIREITMRHAPECAAPWSDLMPTQSPDYVCAKSLDPSNPASKRTCHGDSGSPLQQTDTNGITTPRRPHFLRLGGLPGQRTRPLHARVHLHCGHLPTHRRLLPDSK